MELNDLEQAIQECMDGDLVFQNGENLLCFLYSNTWYPLLPIVRRAFEIAQNPIEGLTPREALHRLFNVLPYVRYQTVNVQNHQLVDLTPQEKLNEIRTLSEMIINIAAN